MLFPRFLRPRTGPAIMAGLLLAAGAVTAIGVGCSKKDSGDASSGGYTVGALYVGTKDDYGYNEAHADGIAAIKKMSGVKVVEDEAVAEDKNCENSMETMVNKQGAKLVFATSFGYFPHVKAVAAKYPNVTFLHAGGHLSDDDQKSLPNVGTYFAQIDELEYLCGMVAGMTTKSNKLGYVAAKLIPPVRRDINAFELGARSVNPKATLTVIYTGGWFEPTKEADAVTNLANAGVDVISGHVDSPKVLVEQAEKHGMWSCGYHFNGSALSPKLYLTGAEWNWGPMYTKFVTDIQKDPKLKPINIDGSIRNGSVQLSPYGPAVSDAAKKAVEPVLAGMKAGTFKMYKGPIKDTTGAIKIKDGDSMGDQDGAIWGIDYMVEGVIGNGN